ncbi:uncharacterized protein VP01_1800g6 [Puccinia sorghi]|uniref:Retrotransposon gag domain-containing protein n=1 Tax=Puccinia sorghi TaxID=27349 RepID=A0A0L6VEV5_9BASI|nr:uncharacterized protein VP01_1800g6 [Puccinia sorghi]
MFVALVARGIPFLASSVLTDARKLVFAALFMQDYAATWCQTYLNRIFSGELLDWTDFLKDLEASFFDHNRRQHTEVALRNIHQTGTVSNYTQEFKQHARTSRWANAPLMILYQNGLKENVQLAVVMRNIQFNSLRSMQAMAVKVGQTIEGIQLARPAPSTSTRIPAPDHNVKDLSAFQRGQSTKSPTPSVPAGSRGTSASAAARRATYPADV